MPATYTYPGVYVEEAPSVVHPVAGVTTSETAFVDYFPRGPLNMPKRVTSLAEFERRFGGLDANSEASYAIRHYFSNGGSAAWIVRVASGTGNDAPKAASVPLKKGSDDILEVDAASEGKWGEGLQVGVDTAGLSGVFNLVVRELATVGGAAQVVGSEVYRNLTMDPNDAARYALNVVNPSSQLIQLVRKSTANSTALPDATSGSAITPSVIANADDSTAFKPLTQGRNGTPPDRPTLKTGVDALDTIAPFVFNILCLPRASVLVGNNQAATDAAVKGAYEDALDYCRRKRAILLIDPPPGINDVDAMTTWRNAAGKMPKPDPNAAIYWPRLNVADPLQGGLTKSLGASGAVAGIFARTDATRGVWKAPAGTEAGVAGGDLAAQVNDAQQGNLNVLGVNVLRTFPIFGNVVWGARTTVGADQAASEWKYLPVRRMALYIEESLYQGLKWVVFEPNDEPLWAQIRLNVGSFMHQLYRQGAFAGATPKDAYLVKCDKDTTTQADVDRGIVNILVGFLPLKPAEFVVIRIQQLAGQIET
jgi:Bacteriophage tail sheath protein